ncbi:MAG: hypothetical protein HYS81_02545 [Candidatus Aenigmatarchaeota archaeon]|nr:MAG: hypothetical protein HYS81_02545 [Candidatus Aenigmarchaeota archaeon]
MGAALKFVFGLVLLLVGLYLIAPIEILSKPALFDWYGPFVALAKGAIPPFLILLGTLIVWIEGEELKSGKK